MEMKEIIFTILKFSIMICLLGCSQSKPQKSEIVGIWANADGATLQFKNDGTFLGKSLPVGSFSMDNKKHSNETFNCSGKWVIEGVSKSWDQLPWRIYLTFGEGFAKEKIGGEYLMISGSGFLENKAPWKSLFLWEGEEGGNRYEFSKK